MKSKSPLEMSNLVRMRLDIHVPTRVHVQLKRCSISRRACVRACVNVHPLCLARSVNRSLSQARGTDDSACHVRMEQLSASEDVRFLRLCVERFSRA